MLRRVSILALAAACAALTATAQADEDELLLLPGQGEVVDDAVRERTRSDRLKPGSGLFITFDEDLDGRISQAEIDAGIPAAFLAADANQDGYVTALEQQAWAERLPTRDDSLANPFRFDPNLDRRVDVGEFTLVINNLATDYADEESGDIIVADLKAPRTRREQRRDEAGESRRRDRSESDRSRRNQSARN